MHWRKMYVEKGIPFPEKRKSGRVVKEPVAAAPVAPNPTPPTSTV
jgi:hypothetical protein